MLLNLTDEEITCLKSACGVAYYHANTDEEECTYLSILHKIKDLEEDTECAS